MLDQMVLHSAVEFASERQLMVFFPEHNLLYGSDPFQVSADGSFFYPQTVTELTDAVAREHLAVSEFFMMHVGLTQWSELNKAVAAAELHDTPSGGLYIPAGSPPIP